MQHFFSPQSGSSVFSFMHANPAIQAMGPGCKLFLKCVGFHSLGMKDMVSCTCSHVKALRAQMYLEAIYQVMTDINALIENTGIS